MENNERFGKKVRIDKDTSSITIVVDNKYWCAVNINDSFIDRALECNSIASLNMLFKECKYYAK